nr:unnamed protein product [Callosobruchus analis]
MLNAQRLMVPVYVHQDSQANSARKTVLMEGLEKIVLINVIGCDANQNARKASMVQTVRKLAFARTTVRAIQKRASATVPGDGKETIAASLVKKATMV